MLIIGWVETDRGNSLQRVIWEAVIQENIISQFGILKTKSPHSSQFINSFTRKKIKQRLSSPTTLKYTDRWKQWTKFWLELSALVWTKSQREWPNYHLLRGPISRLLGCQWELLFLIFLYSRISFTIWNWVTLIETSLLQWFGFTRLCRYMTCRTLVHVAPILGRLIDIEKKI